jgi:hypothetical protein
MLEFKFFVHLMDKFCQIRTIPGLANDRTLFLRFSRPRTSHAAFVGYDQSPPDIAQEFNDPKIRHESLEVSNCSGHFSILVGPVAVFDNHYDRDSQETGTTSIQ